RTQALRQLTPHFEHKLFLTATPHNGYVESFSALLELLDDQRFARGTLPDHRQLEAVMVRRLKSELPPRFDGSPRFPNRELEALAGDKGCGKAHEDAVDAAGLLFREPTEEEAGLLSRMKQWATTASARPDAKAHVLVRWLEDNIRAGGKWSERRVIIFTEYRA